VGQLTGKEGVEKRDKIFFIKSISQNENQRHYVFHFIQRSGDTQRGTKVQSGIQNWTP